MTDPEVLILRREVERLTRQVELWKDAWFRQRDATGKNYWAGRERALQTVATDWEKCCRSLGYRMPRDP